MRRNRKYIYIIITAVAMAGFSSCSFIKRDITLIDAKTAVSVDGNLMPVNLLEIFPRGTSKISCWFQWKDAKVNTQIVARWHYVTDDVPILEYNFNIPRKDGSGSVTLTMPEGKTLPPGSYKVSLFLNKRILKSLAFKIE